MISSVDLYALQLLDGVGDATLRKLIKADLTPKDLLRFDTKELRPYFTTDKGLNSFINSFANSQERAEYEIQSLRDSGTELVSYYSDDYPRLLKSLDDFPLFLYCIGNVELLNSSKNIAVIGTRENSEVGASIARGTAKYFANNGYTIVSGLARGIDSIAHQAALDVNGFTIAVLVDVAKIYPKENAQLAKDIVAKRGLLVSENKPGSFQNKSSFVIRDRIQSGLSLAIFPIETDIDGGTMHTVKYAKKQNRLIFVPDLANPNLIASYKNKVSANFSKLSGIRETLNLYNGVPYTKETYEDVEKRLDAELAKYVIGANNVNLKYQAISISQSLNDGKLIDDNPSKVDISYSNDQGQVDHTSKSGEILTGTEDRKEFNNLSKDEMVFVQRVQTYLKLLSRLCDDKLTIIGAKDEILSETDLFVKDLKKISKKKSTIRKKTESKGSENTMEFPL